MKNSELFLSLFNYVCNSLIFFKFSPSFILSTFISFFRSVLKLHTFFYPLPWSNYWSHSFYCTTPKLISSKPFFNKRCFFYFIYRNFSSFYLFPLHRSLIVAHSNFITWQQQLNTTCSWNFRTFYHFIWIEIVAKTFPIISFYNLTRSIATKRALSKKCQVHTSNV